MYRDANKSWSFSFHQVVRVSKLWYTFEKLLVLSLLFFCFRFAFVIINYDLKAPFPRHSNDGSVVRVVGEWGINFYLLTSEKHFVN